MERVEGAENTQGIDKGQGGREEGYGEEERGEEENGGEKKERE